MIRVKKFLGVELHCGIVELNARHYVCLRQIYKSHKYCGWGNIIIEIKITTIFCCGVKYTNTN
jgi:hypothetical protein